MLPQWSAPFKRKECSHQVKYLFEDKASHTTDYELQKTNESSVIPVVNICKLEWWVWCVNELISQHPVLYRNQLCDGFQFCS